MAQDELAAAFAAITRTERRAAVRYAVRAEAAHGAATEDALLAALRAARAKDLATGATQVGPHRDDLAFELDGREAGAYASQGQLRAIMLAWKTAELAVLARAHGDSPILLLVVATTDLNVSLTAELKSHNASDGGIAILAKSLLIHFWHTTRTPIPLGRSRGANVSAAC